MRLSDSIPSNWEELIPHELPNQIAIYGGAAFIIVALLVMWVRKHHHRQDCWWDGADHLRNLSVRQAKQKQQERDRYLGDGGH